MMSDLWHPQILHNMSGGLLFMTCHSLSVFMHKAHHCIVSSLRVGEDRLTFEFVSDCLENPSRISQHHSEYNLSMNSMKRSTDGMREDEGK